MTSNSIIKRIFKLIFAKIKKGAISTVTQIKKASLEIVRTLDIIPFLVIAQENFTF